MKNSILTLCILLICSALSGQTDDVIRNYMQLSKADGLSHNYVTIIAEDIYNRIWIGTAGGLDIFDSNQLHTQEGFGGIHINSLYDTGTEMLIGTPQFIEAYNYETGTYTRVQHNGQDVRYAFSIISRQEQIWVVAANNLYTYHGNQLELVREETPYAWLSMDKFGVLWGRSPEEIYRLDDQFNVAKKYRLASSDHSPLTPLSFYPDSKGIVWVGTVKDGIYRYNRALDEFFKEDLAGKYGVREIENIGSIHEDQYDRLWIGHNSGVSLYDYSNDYFRDYRLENSNHITINTTVTQLYRTSKKDMVIGTFFTGFFYINDLNTGITFYNLGDLGANIGGVAGNGILQHGKDELWIGSNCMGIVRMKKDGTILERINRQNGGINDNILPIEADSSGFFWAGSLSNGLYRIGPDRRIRHYLNHPQDSTSLSGRTVHTLKLIDRNHLLVATNTGVDILDFRTDRFRRIITSGPNNFAFSNILSFNNYLYIINFHTIFRYDKQSGEIKEYTFPEHQLYIQSAYADSKGTIWLGSSRGELFRFHNEVLQPAIPASELSNSDITGIQEDPAGNLWLASGYELFRISPTLDIKRFNLAWGMGKNEFNVRSSFRDPEGNIYFGTSDGVVCFNPVLLSNRHTEKPTLFISDFKLFNESVQPGVSKLLPGHINNTRKITLENKQNFISFEISRIDYNHEQSFPYKCYYRLHKFDNNWYEVNPSSNEITFTGLTTGTYFLHIRLEGESGETLDYKEIEIEVKPHFLLSGYMQAAYLLLILFILGILQRSFKRQRRTREIINRAKQEKAELTKLNALKLDFFTYITHEFKTPLAIISTLQNEILPFSSEPDSDVDIFKRNVKRLDFLVNQLMEFRNMESSHTSVHIGKYDLIPFLRGIYQAFTPLYKHKNISYDFLCETESLPMLFDPDKLEMLIGNLLSNTFKHTEQGGTSYIRVTQLDKKVIIDIFNSGKCISEDRKKAIFQPYNRTDSSDEYANSGIGLAIVNSIARLLEIELSVLQIENEGNIFRAEIPLVQDDAVEENRTGNPTSIVDNIIDNTIYIEEQTHAQTLSGDEKTTFRVLIAENDTDTKKILKKKLQPHYHILTASSGKEALLLMKSQYVDVVVTDIRMGEMNGYELCRAIKENNNTKHIPVLMITSDLSAEAKIRGFQAGADAFLQKPINIQELLLRLDNIVKNKHVLRAYYANFNPVPVETHEVNNADEIFIRELTTYIYEHLNDTNLSVHQLAHHVNVSRTQLYLNIKRLTGDTPSAFVLNIKMTRARKLLLTTDMTSSEISYMLGYCNPNHFSRQFKEFYKVSPSEFRKQQQATP